MKKRIYLIHGWEGKPEGAFRPWLKQQLELNGYSVDAPTMPDTNHPKMEAWLSHLQKIVTSPSEETILVGHSLGGAIVLRYLEALPEGKVLAKAVCVAGVVDQITNLSEKEKIIAEPWLTTPIDAEKVKRSAKEIVAFFSDNDQFIPLDTEKVMQEKFNARTYIEHNKGHYNEGPVPIILKEIMN